MLINRCAQPLRKRFGSSEAAGLSQESSNGHSERRRVIPDRCMLVWSLERLVGLGIHTLDRWRFVDDLIEVRLS